MTADRQSARLTLLLDQVEQGGDAAAAELLPLVYDELRALAGSFLRNQRKDHTLQPTALVHEAFAKMIGPGEGKGEGGAERRWSSRAHFFAVAAKAMRQVLANYARDRGAAKRGGGWRRVELRDEAATPAFDVDLLALHDALENLTEFDSRQCKVVELRFFAEMTTDEIAHVLDISPSTVEREWRMARAWLSARLAGDVRDDRP